MMSKVIKLPARGADAVVLPPLKEDYNTTFHSVLGKNLDDASAWTCGIRIVLSIPKTHPDTGESIDHESCDALVNQLANSFNDNFVSRGARLDKLVCVVDWVPDGWLMTLIVDAPSFIQLEQVRRLCEISGMPDIVAKTAFVTFVHGHAEAEIMLHRISACEAECD